MARQELANTFSDGLMMDLNPINTPKSVLTDCLNGTYITYNGNEFVLQNDMGNYKLKNCKLSTNFIPVGVKGYGDILYIVSYNPITNETEIGSYPAPQSIFTAGDSEAKIANTDDLAPFIWGEGSSSKEVEYPTIIRTNKKPIFIFTDSNEETYKLNPGDEFKFTGELTSLAFIYQHLNFYIIDEDNKLYDIDDTQIYENGTLISSDTMRKVFWETPGWLAAQYDLYVPDKFNLNLRSLNVPEFLVAQSNNETSQAEGKLLDELEPDEKHFKVSMDLSSQTIITDKLFQTELDKNFGNINDDLNTNMSWEKNPANVYDHLYIRYLIKRNIDPPDVGEDDYGTFKGIVVSIDDTHTQDYTNGVIDEDKNYIYYDIPVWKHNYQDDIITAYNNIRPIWFCNNPKTLPNSEDLDMANYHGVVELTAYPVIKYNDLTLKYTQFSTTQRFPLNTLKNSSDITIADSIYKWSVDDDSCTISFNINGPFINASDITGRYEIYRINLFNRAESEEDAKSQAAEGTNENPKSVSSYNVKEGLIGDFLVEENNKWIRKLDQSVSANSFTPEEKLLMCEGRLSNLVLYGQNTLNIDWNSSKEYILNSYCNYYTNPDYDFTEGADNGDLEKAIKDTSFIGYNEDIAKSQKTINFSKEGGIYIFRVILEQNGSQLAETKQILIPSEVFNEWFGSIDNYLDKTNGITSSMWVGKWLDQIHQSIIINSININFSENRNDVYKGIYYIFNNNEYPLSEVKTSTNTWEEAIASILNKSTKTRDGYEFNSYPETNISFLIKLNEILDNTSEIDWNFNSMSLKGNLWNAIFSENVILKDTNSNILNIVNNQIVLKLDLIIPWNLILSGQTQSSSLLSEQYAFFNYPDHTIKRGTLYANDGGHGGANDDYGRALYVDLNVDGSSTRLQGAMGSGNCTDANHGTINTIYNTSKMSSCGYLLILTLRPQDSGNTWRSAFVNDSDGNADNAYVNEIVSTPNTKNVVCIMSAGESTIQPNAVAIIDFNGGIGAGSSNSNCTRFMNALSHIKIVRYSESKTSLYYPIYSVNLIEQNQYSITKGQIDTLLKYLRADDTYVYPNISSLKIFNNILFSDNLYISNQKQNYINLSPILVTLNYRQNAGYQSMISTLISGFTDYESAQDDNKQSAEERPTGTSIIFDPSDRDRDTLPTDFFSTFGTMNVDFTEDYINWIKDDVVRRNSTRSWSISNVGYKTDGYTFKATNVGSDRGRSPGFIFGYYQWIDRDL